MAKPTEEEIREACADPYGWAERQPGRWTALARAMGVTEIPVNDEGNVVVTLTPSQAARLANLVAKGERHG